MVLLAKSRSRWIFVSLGMLALAVVALVVLAVQRATRPKYQNLPRTAATNSAGRTTAATPFDQGEGYVGSSACAQCHSKITNQYNATHSMSRATRAIGEEDVLEDYAHGLVRPPGFRVYQVKRNDKGTWHHEVMLDREGRVIYDQGEQIRYAIGSGRRGRSYLLDRDGLLFQSPISWYTQKQAWDLSPGYEAESHLRFDRKITAECIYCHAGRPAIEDFGCDRFQSPAFLETGIGCERCHGPGGDHVAKQQSGTGEHPDNTIVQPARFEAAKRDSVCYQCHLRARFVVPRKGRDHYDFRPGQRYEDVWVALVEGGDDPKYASSVVQQFRASACFRQSNGQLGCISCHDPHSRPAEDQQASFYYQKCLKCHSENACGLSPEKRGAEPARNSCIHCHMPRLPTKGIPHTALTDHRVLARPETVPLLSAENQDLLDTLHVFTSDAAALPRAEVDRAWARVYATYAISSQDIGLAHRAISMAAPQAESAEAVLALIGDDVESLERISVAWAMTGRPDIAFACWQRGLELQPTNEAILRSATLFRLTTDDYAGGLATANRLLAVNPFVPQYHYFRAQLYEQSGNLKEAICSAERLVALDPSSISVRGWLRDAYERAGDKEKSHEQQAIVERMTRH